MPEGKEKHNLTEVEKERRSLSRATERFTETQQSWQEAVRSGDAHEKRRKNLETWLSDPRISEEDKERMNKDFEKSGKVTWDSYYLPQEVCDDAGINRGYDGIVDLSMFEVRRRKMDVDKSIEDIEREKGKGKN